MMVYYDDNGFRTEEGEFRFGEGGFRRWEEDLR